MNSATRAQGKKKLEIVSDIVRSGGVVRAPIWMLLGWFEHERRGHRVDGNIRWVLEECQLETRPDFTDRDLDTIEIVEFRNIPKKRP